MIVTQTPEGRMASHALLTTLTRDDRQRKGEQLQQEMPDMRPAGDRVCVCVCVCVIFTFRGLNTNKDNF